MAQAAVAERDLRAAVIDLVRENQGVRRTPLTDTTRLLQDLGIGGDDAVEFFGALGAGG